MYATNATLTSNLTSNLTISDKLIDGQARLAAVTAPVAPAPQPTAADREAADAERALRVLWMQRFRL